MSVTVLISIVTLGISIVSAFAKLAYDYSRVSARVNEIEKDIISMQGQIAELYQNRLETNIAIAKLTMAIESIGKRLDSVEKKIDILINRRVFDGK